MSALALLKQACDKTSQAKVAKEIGYSATVVNLVLKGTYTGDIKKVEKTIMLRLGSSSVDCPVLGEIKAARCNQEQNREFSTANSHRVRMFRACMNCPFNTKRSSHGSV